MLEKRGQVTIFVIIAVVIIAGIIGYFLLRGEISIGGIPSSLKPVEEYFLSCIEDETEIGAEILGGNGGYIYAPEFSPGSEYRPFSSQLNFFGFGIPYWYYVSGNNIIKEQKPSKADMERQLERYLEENLGCDFSDFLDKGFEVDLSEVKADVKIYDNKISVALIGGLSAGFGDESYIFMKHDAEINSKLGKFYDSALKIYNYEKQDSFLENYAVDVLRMYAPVDGVELSCAPKIWMKNDVDVDLKEALEANMQAIRFGSGEGYFSQGLNIGEQVNVLYDKSWPTRIEIWDSNNGVMLAEPVGLQPGLGILGFCYVPYHFVYDVNFPALIQVYDEDYLFQFPVAVIIDKNKAREALPVTGVLDTEPELCKYKYKEVSVYTYNNELEGVEADIGFECLAQRCDIGRSEISGGDSVLKGKFPACVNGFISAKADGYAQKRYQFSTNQEGSVNLILDKLYDLNLELKVNGKETSDKAVISFVSEDNVQTLAWPEQKKVRLSEGQYNISVYVYRNSSITIPGMKKEICNEVPKSGLLGLFGQTEEKCFDVDFPSQELSSVVSGGGKSSEYIIESQLQKGKITVSVQGFSVPKSLEELEDTYGLLEVKPVYVDFG